MFARIFSAFAAVAAVAWGSALAATVTVDVTDTSGMPAPNAVVSLAPESTTAMPAHAPQRSIIDQRHETFLPLVVAVRRGGEVVFTNNDVTRHQVYSFSPIKQFQFVIDQGHVSQPVIFDKSGVAAIGCNIHDSMVAFVYVADAPFAVVTDAKGHAAIPDVPDGAYRAQIWHPQMRAAGQMQAHAVTIAGNEAKLSFAVPLAAGGMPGMSHMHKSDY